MKMKIDAGAALERAESRQYMGRLEEMIKEVADNGGVRIEFLGDGKRLRKYDGEPLDDFQFTEQMWKTLEENGYSLEMSVDHRTTQTCMCWTESSLNKITYTIDWSQGFIKR